MSRSKLCSLGNRSIDEQSEYPKNGRSKLQGRCELSGGQRFASSVYLVYCPSPRPGLSQRIWTPRGYGPPGPYQLADSDPYGTYPLADITPFRGISHSEVDERIGDEC